MTKKINRAQYTEMRDEDGTVLEAVFRMQEAQSEKKCASEDCLLGGRILPLMRYARVFYEDNREIATYHYSCFRKEFHGTGKF